METGKIKIKSIESPSQDEIIKIVELYGNIDESSVDKLSIPIYELIENNTNNLFLIFDLEEVKYMNSKTIGYLTDWSQRVNKNKGKLIICRANTHIKNTLESVGVQELLPIYESLEEAKQAVFNKTFGGQGGT